MSYRINAWLERKEPQLIISSSRTGQVLMDWRGDKVRELIGTGQLDTQLLAQSGIDCTEVVKDLLLVY